MSLTTSEMTPADLAAVTGNNNNGAFGMDGGAWWIIILFLFVFMGWGGNGWGNNGMNGFNGAGAQGALTRQDLCMDMNFNDLKNSVSNIRNGIYEGFSSTAVQNMQGQNAIQQTISQGFADNTLANTQSTNALNQKIDSVSRQITDCCCQNRYDALQNANNIQRAVDNANYNMATNTCSINTNATQNTQAIVQNQNDNTRAILDALTAQSIEQKNEKIAEQAQQINALNLAASQAAQNNYIINALRPSPIPAYITQNPYCCFGQQCAGYYGGTTLA